MTENVSIANGDLDEDFLEAAYQSGRVAWDIETSGLDWRSDAIATCQIHVPDFGTEIIRINSCIPKNLTELLREKEISKTFHHAMFDLRFMRAKWKVQPANIACTKVLAKVLTPGLSSNAYSLKSLLLSNLGIQMDKGLQTSNWMAAEISTEQITYAVRDVIYLLPLIDRLLSQAQSIGIENIVQGSFDFIPHRVETDLRNCGDVYSY